MSGAGRGRRLLGFRRGGKEAELGQQRRLFPGGGQLLVGAGDPIEGLQAAFCGLDARGQRAQFFEGKGLAGGRPAAGVDPLIHPGRYALEVAVEFAQVINGGAQRAALGRQNDVPRLHGGLDLVERVGAAVVQKGADELLELVDLRHGEASPFQARCRSEPPCSSCWVVTPSARAMSATI